MRITFRAVGVALLVGALAACSSSSKSGAPTSTTTSTTTDAHPLTTTASQKCFATKPIEPPVVTKVAGVASDWTLTAFDGAKIRLHWFPVASASVAHPAPTVLMGPGWGESGDTDTASAGLFGSVNLGSLLKASYNVLTWDPRGFGASTGTVEVDSAAYEGRDVEKMLDWISKRPGVLLDGAGDPRVGMAGGSYGGGIQLIAAAIDCRVDAITPLIAWHSLTTSLYKANTPKNGWAGLLFAATAGRSIDPHITHSHTATVTTGVLDQDDVDWFASRGPDDLIKKIKIPTLIVQGTVDNLFTLDEGITNYRILRDDNVPTAMVWFCGGHGVCLTNPGRVSDVGTAVLAWLDRYVKRDTSVDTGPRFAFVDQNGTRYTAPDYPLPTGTPITAHGAGALNLGAEGGSGPAHPAADNKDPLAGVAASITPAQASTALNVSVNFTTAAVVVGAPKLTISYKGTVPAGVQPTRVFAQLVDGATGTVLGNQVTPIEVTLDGKAHTTTVSLEDVAFTGHVGAHVTLQIVGTTVAYAQPRLGGTITFSSVDISLPAARDLTAK